MKKLAGLTALAMLVGSMSIAVPASAATTTDLGAGWSMSVADGVTLNDTKYVCITDKEAHSGNNSLHFNLPNSQSGVIDITHAANPTTAWSGDWGDTNKWRVEFYAKSDTFDWYNNKDFKYYTQIGPFDCENVNNANGTRIRLDDQKITWSEPDENGWRKGSFEYIYPYSWEKPQFHIRLAGYADNMYIDDISVTYLGTSFLGDISLLADGGFEFVEATGENLEDYGWHASYNNSGIPAGYEAAAEIVKDSKGNRMLHVKAPHTGNGWQKMLILKREIATNLVDIDWGAYQIKFKIRGAYSTPHLEVGSGGYDEHLRFLNNTEKVTTKKLDDGWTEYTIVTQGQNTGGSNSLNSFRLQSYGRSNSFYIDDVQVQKISDEVPAKGDHLYNGNFDNEKTNSAVEAKSWEKVVSSSGDSRYITTRSGKYAYTGKSSMFISAPGSYNDNQYIQFNQALPTDFDASGEATLTMKMRTTNPNTTLYAYYGDTSTNGKMSANVYLDSTATVKELGNDWYQYTVKMPALEKGQKPHKLAIEAMNAVDGIWIDDISLVGANGKEAIENGSFEDYEKYVIGSAYILNEDGDEVYEPSEGENTIYVPVTTNEAGLNYNLFFVVYKNGQIFKMDKCEYKNASVGDKELEATITLDTVDDGTYTARAFVWNDNMVPYTNSIDFEI